MCAVFSLHFFCTLCFRKELIFIRARLIILMAAIFVLTSCAAPTQSGQSFSVRTIPSPKEFGDRPQLDVFIVADNRIESMDVETYVAGVVAGEMRSDWPMEALKAQAILARTFVMKFVTEKTSRYPGADISTDVAEAQAYDADAVDERILAAISATTGEILLSPDGTLPYTWFHAHSGGMTELARAGIDWQGAEPSHTRVTQGLDSPDAPASARFWEASFSAEDFTAACRRAGSEVHSCRSVVTGETGQSGRAVTLLVDGVPVNSARLRIELGSTRMRSTLLTRLTTDGETIRMAGRGYGHGVGMPQWGAYALAQDGLAGEEIALHYYNGLEIVRAWE